MTNRRPALLAVMVLCTGFSVGCDNADEPEEQDVATSQRWPGPCQFKTVVGGEERGITRYDYDAAGNVESVEIRSIERLAGSDLWTASLQGDYLTFEHDADARTTQVETARIEGMGDDLVISLTDNLVEQFTYDPAGRLTTYVDHDGARVTVTYDDQGRLARIERQDAMGAATGRFDHTYGEDGQLARIDHHAGDGDGASSTTAVSHDAAGRTTTFADDFDLDGTVDRVTVATFDARGNLVEWARDGAADATPAAPGATDGVYDITELFTYDRSDNLLTAGPSPEEQRRFSYLCWRPNDALAGRWRLSPAEGLLLRGHIPAHTPLPAF